MEYCRSVSAILFSLVVSTLAFTTTGYAWEDEARNCTDEAVLRRISRNFDYQVRHVPRLPEVAIETIERIRQHRYIPASENWPIARRYCNGTALFSDGRKRRIWFLIERRQGFAGIGDNIEFCVLGFDRWNVYDGYCRVLR